MQLRPKSLPKSNETRALQLIIFVDGFVFYFLITIVSHLPSEVLGSSCLPFTASLKGRLLDCEIPMDPKSPSELCYVRRVFRLVRDGCVITGFQKAGPHMVTCMPSSKKDAVVWWEECPVDRSINATKGSHRITGKVTHGGQTFVLLESTP